jgi:transcriptional regulator with XRE-family HTH domain
MQKELILLLRKRLKSKGLSHTEVAKQIGISRVTVTKYLTCKSDIRASKLISILNLVGIDIYASLGGGSSTGGSNGGVGSTNISST